MQYPTLTTEAANRLQDSEPGSEFIPATRFFCTNTGFAGAKMTYNLALRSGNNVSQPDTTGALAIAD